MTSDEIKQWMSIKDPRKELPLVPGENGFWLAEIAYQLAIMNEQMGKTVIPYMQVVTDHASEYRDCLHSTPKEPKADS